MNTHELAVELANRPYTIMTSVDTTESDNVIYVARTFEIEGCFGQGESSEEAIADLKLALADFIESMLEDGLSVPDPTKTELVSASNKSVNVSTFVFSGGPKSIALVEDKNIPVDVYVFSA